MPPTSAQSPPRPSSFCPKQSPKQRQPPSQRCPAGGAAGGEDRGPPAPRGAHPPALTGRRAAPSPSFLLPAAATPGPGEQRGRRCGGRSGAGAGAETGPEQIRCRSRYGAGAGAEMGPVPEQKQGWRESGTVPVLEQERGGSRSGAVPSAGAVPELERCRSRKELERCQYWCRSRKGLARCRYGLERCGWRSGAGPGATRRVGAVPELPVPEGIGAVPVPVAFGAVRVRDPALRSALRWLLPAAAPGSVARSAALPSQPARERCGREPALLGLRSGERGGSADTHTHTPSNTSPGSSLL